MSTKRNTTTARKAATKIRQSGGDLLGEIITWNMSSAGTLDHTQVKSELRAAGLDDGVSRKILPRHAFTRAAKAMRDGRAIDKVKDGDDVITFQFTKKFCRDNDIEFKKEAIVRLNKTSGIVSCDDKSIEETAQNEVDRCTVERTTSDVTKIIQKLFDDSADMFPIREQGGVYFVPAAHTDFTAKVQLFVEKLNGHVVRFPVMKGTKQGDSSVAMSVKATMESMIQDHIEAVDGFTLSTGSNTIETQAEKIKQTRVKLEAYADYLGREAKALTKQVEDANKKLTAKIKSLDSQRLKAPAKDGKRVFGHPVTAVIRFMGSEGWTFKQARESLDRLNIDVSDPTVKTQLSAGQKSKDDKGYRGEPAKLSATQIKTLKNGPAKKSAAKKKSTTKK